MPYISSPSTLYQTSFIQAQKDRYRFNEIKNGFDHYLIKQHPNFSAYINWLQNHFGLYLKLLKQKQQAHQFPFVPQQDYWLVDSTNFLGRSTIRYSLTSKLKQQGGHIGYYVNPRFRHQGYGTILLKQTIKIARAKNITPILLTTGVHNVASQKVIQKAGGECINHSTKLYYFRIN